MTSTTWHGVPSFIAQQLCQAGYTRPSLVQLKALPLVRLGVDVVVQARAGTGKTLVFAIAAAEKALLASGKSSRKVKPGGPRVLFIAPTREIALQGAGVLSDVSSGCGMTVVTCIGGLPTSEDERLLRKGCDVVIGTPGRLAALLVDRESLDPSSIDMLVLDEADRLMEDSFYGDVRRMVARLCQPYQLLALSATFESPSVERLESLRSPQAGTDGKKLFICSAMGTPTSVVHYRLLWGEEGQDEEGQDEETGYGKQLEHVFGRVPFRQAIVFCPSRKKAEETTRELRKGSHAAALLSSDVDQLARIRALNDLRQYRTRILVCTDVAARGID